MTEKLSPSKPLLGYTDKSTVKLDFDDAPFAFVKYWAFATLKWFRLGGFIILKSSKNHYHVVFDSARFKTKQAKSEWVCCYRFSGLAA